MSSPESPRIGFGWDRHRLAAGRRCVLGGVEIPSPLGPVAHSDGDAVLHALCDALLGAAGLDDLGSLFPDDDPQCEGAPSTRFLAATLEQLRAHSLRPLSVDLVVICDQPRIGPQRAAIRARLAELLGLPVDRVNLKGKSTEGGAADRLEVSAVALLGPA